jgi:hypothetical protein
MIDFNEVAELRPPAAPLDPALKAHLRAQLFGDVASTGGRPAEQIVEISSVRRHGRERRWKLAVPAVAAAVLLLGLAIIARRPASGPNAEESTAAVNPSAVPAASPESSTANTVGATGTVGLPPEVEVPTVVPILDPNPFAEPPLREDPLETWLSYTPDQTRWFVKRDESGAPVNGITVELWAAAEWYKSFSSGKVVDLGPVQARTQGDPVWVIAWPVDGGMLAIRSVGVDEATLLDFGHQNADATTPARAVVPSGWAEVPVPEPLSLVFYEAEGVSLSLKRVDPAVDVSMLAFMESSGTSVVEPLSADTVRVTSGSGDQTLITRLDPDRYLTIDAPKGADLSRLLSNVRLVPPDRVATWTFGNPIPADAVVNVGEMSRGRWYALRYGYDDGLCLTFIIATSGGSGGCVPQAPGNERCPMISSGGGVDIPWTFTVLFPYDTGPSVITVSPDGVAADVTVERSGGFTFVTGPSSENVNRYDILIDGQPPCPWWAEQSRTG